MLFPTHSNDIEEGGGGGGGWGGGVEYNIKKL